MLVLNLQQLLPVLLRAEVKLQRLLAARRELTESTGVGFWRRLTQFFKRGPDDCGVYFGPSGSAVLLQGFWGPVSVR